jgi:hypothetical protein
VVRYLRSRARHLKICRGDAAALRQLIDFLRRQGVIPAERIQSHLLSPIEQVVQEFERYLLNERALAPTTAIHYASFVRGFLANRCCRGSVRFGEKAANMAFSRYPPTSVLRSLHIYGRGGLATAALGVFSYGAARLSAASRVLWRLRHWFDITSPAPVFRRPHGALISFAMGWPRICSVMAPH